MAQVSIFLHRKEMFRPSTVTWDTLISLALHWVLNLYPLSYWITAEEAFTTGYFTQHVKYYPEGFFCLFYRCPVTQLLPNSLLEFWIPRKYSWKEKYFTDAAMNQTNVKLQKQDFTLRTAILKTDVWRCNPAASMDSLTPASQCGNTNNWKTSSLEVKKNPDHVVWTPECRIFSSEQAFPTPPLQLFQKHVWQSKYKRENKLSGRKLCCLGKTFKYLNIWPGICF